MDRQTVLSALEQARTLGGKVAELVQPVLAHRQRAAQLGAELERVRQDEERRFAGVVELLAGGQLDVIDAPDQLADKAFGFDSPASRAVVAAQAASYDAGDRAMAEQAPLIFAELQRLVAGYVKEVAGLLAKLPAGVVDEASAFRSGQAGREAWARLQALLADGWQRPHDLADTLRVAGWVAGPVHARDGWREGRVPYGSPLPWIGYLAPWKLPAGFGRRAPEVQVAVAAAAEAGPGLYPWDDAIRRMSRYHAATGWARDDTPMTTVTTIDKNEPWQAVSQRLAAMERDLVARATARAVS